MQSAVVIISFCMSSISLIESSFYGRKPDEKHKHFSIIISTLLSLLGRSFAQELRYKLDLSCVGSKLACQFLWRSLTARS